MVQGSPWSTKIQKRERSIIDCNAEATECRQGAVSHRRARGRSADCCQESSCDSPASQLLDHMKRSRGREKNKFEPNVVVYTKTSSCSWTTDVALSGKGRVCFSNVMVSRSRCPCECAHQSQALYGAFHGWNRYFFYLEIQKKLPGGTWGWMPRLHACKLQGNGHIVEFSPEQMCQKEHVFWNAQASFKAGKD